MGASTETLIEPFGPQFLAFWSYWNSLPKHGLVPHLRDYLDNAPPALQPRVALLDVTSASDMRVRLAGTIVTEFVGEITGSDVQDVYQGEARRVTIESAWTSVNHPCGYSIVRTVISKNGNQFNPRALALPLKTDTVGSKTVASFNLTPERYEPELTESVVPPLLTHPTPTWIDIGAGVPDSGVPES